MTYDPFRLKPAGDWHSRPRANRLANVLYPHLAPKDVQQEMVALAKLEHRDASLAKRIQSGTEKLHNPWGIKRR